MVENPKNLSEQKPEPFDKEWYDRFEQCGSFAAYEYLNGDAEYRKNERRQFEAGEIENPILDYPNLSAEDLDSKEQRLLELKNDILSFETNDLVNTEKIEVVKQVYRWRLNEKIAEARLLKAAKNGNERRFQRYSHFIYGKPSPEIFSYTVNFLHNKIEECLASDNIGLKEAAQDLKAVLPDKNDLADTETISLPSEEAINLSQEQTFEDMAHIIAVPDTDEEVDASIIHQTFQSAVDKLRTKGWKVVTNPDKTSVSANQEKKEVYVPADRVMTVEKLKGLVVHEIGTHVVRRNQGERSHLRLLGLGLDRYESGEEGVATMREQTMKKEFNDFEGLDRHMAISLAEGLDGKPRDFRQVYDVIYKYHKMRLLAEGKDLEKAEEDAKNESWTRCIRTFRGTSCKTPGVAFTKDIIYREGNIDVWEMVRTNPKEMKRLNVGKYDPTNSRHLWVLTELGITDEDLDELKK